MKEKLIETLGWAGAGAILIAYFLISFSYIDAHSPLYYLLNGAGSLGVGIESFHKHNYQPTVLNVIWLGIAVASLLFAVR